MADEAWPSRLAGLAALSSGDTRLDTLIPLTCGRALSLPPLPSEVDLIDGASDHDAAVAAFAEQFAVDVSGIGAHQCKQLLSTLGDNVFRAVVAIFIADFVPRVWPDWPHSAWASQATTERWNGITTPIRLTRC